MWAVASGHVEMAKFLAQQGGSELLAVTDKGGKRASELCRAGMPDLEELLRFKSESGKPSGPIPIQL